MKTNYIQFTLSGQIESTDQGNYLQTRDGTRLKIKKSPGTIPSGMAVWQVTPSTDSNGTIGSITLESLSQSESSEQCILSGRVTQLGSKGQCVQLKINREVQKALKITVKGSDERMKVGQLWSVVAKRGDNQLILESADPIEVNTDSAQSQPDFQDTDEARGSSASPLLPQLSSCPPPEALKRVRAALEQKTQRDDWQLEAPKQRSAHCWEWEGFCPSLAQKARVKLKGKNLSIYCYRSSSGDEAQPLKGDNERLVVTPLGAARGIGASCFQILIGPYEVVLDCGTRPKGYDPLPALDELKNPNLLLVSHAHQDHLGAVPVFHRRYPVVRMICTPATREIAHVMLTDGLKIQQRSEDSPQLFEHQDLERTLFRLETEPVGQDFEPLPGLLVRFINAGHILGAACIYLRYGQRTLLYTGDFHTTNSRTTTGLILAELPEAEVLITESTYGDGHHPARKSQETALIESILEVVEGGGNVLIPAFALGRAQEILLALRTANSFQKVKVPVYVDGLVRAVTQVFRENLESLPNSVQNLVKITGIEPFFDEKGTPAIIPIQHPSQRPLALAKPSIIVSSSGMLTGGPSVYYAQVLLERENAAIFLSGYTDEESPGRLLQNLQTGDTLELSGSSITVNALVKRFNLSAHADKVGLGQTINRVKPKHLILIHGCISALHELAQSGENQARFYIHIPRVGEKISLEDVPSQISSSQMAKLAQPQEFEVTVEKVDNQTCLRLPNSVVENDPRWQMLSASGVIQAKWDGVGLKLTREWTPAIEEQSQQG